MLWGSTTSEKQETPQDYNLRCWCSFVMNGNLALSVCLSPFLLPSLPTHARMRFFHHLIFLSIYLSRFFLLFSFPSFYPSPFLTLLSSLSLLFSIAFCLIGVLDIPKIIVMATQLLSLVSNSTFKSGILKVRYKNPKMSQN